MHTIWINWKIVLVKQYSAKNKNRNYTNTLMIINQSVTYATLIYEWENVKVANSSNIYNPTLLNAKYMAYLIQFKFELNLNSL